MTDEFDVPMNDRPDDFLPAGHEPVQPVVPAASDVPTTPTPPVSPNPQNPQNLSWPPPAGAPAASSAPPAWGSAPQGWPPPPVPSANPSGPPSGPAFGADAGGGYGPPNGPSYGQAPGSGAPDPAAWSYNYGAGGWGPPPGQSGPPPGTRRALALIAVIVLVLASAGVGAAISEAVHSNDTDTASSNTTPFVPGNGSANNGNGTDPFGNNGLGNNGNGTGNSSGTGRGTSSNSAPAKIVSKVTPAVVNIYTTISNGSSQGEAAGTGMVITASGEVLTNNHVIDGARTIRVQIVDTGETHTAKVVGYDVVDDVALLQIDGVSNLKTVSFADASKVAIGDAVVAIGNAGGRGGTPAATSGSVTALDQKVTAGDVGSAKSETLHGMTQVSAPIQPGDSGGPLVDTDGNVIGMNTAAAQNDDFFSQSGSSVAFAIPIDKARQVVSQIEAGNDSDTVHVGDRGILGVQVQNITSGSNAPVSAGALIAGVESGSPADAAGIAQGAVITSIDGKSVTNASDLTALMFPYHPSDKVQVGWVDQSGGHHSASVGLVSGPPD